MILVSYINKLRQEGMDIHSATREASLLRLRPDHDDRPGGVPRAVAGGPLNRNRIGYAEAVRDCDRRRA